MSEAMRTTVSQAPQAALDAPTLAEKRVALLDQALIEFETLPEMILQIGEAAYLFKWPGYDKEEGLLTEVSLRRAFSKFAALDYAAQEEFQTLLLRFPFSDPLSVVPQACLLKQLAFVDFDKTVFEDLTERLEAFSPEALLQQTSLLDVDPTSNDDPYTPWGTLEERALVPKTMPDEYLRNDGGKQSYRMTCVPAVTLLYRGEWDPAFALQVRAQGFAADPQNNVWLQEQARMAKEVNYQQPPLRLNHLLLDQALILKILDELFVAETVDEKQYKAMLAALAEYVQGNPRFTLLGAGVERRLAALFFTPAQEISDGERFTVGLGQFYSAALDSGQQAAWRLFPYQDEIVAVLRRWGCALDGGWSLFSLFDVEQGWMQGMFVSSAFNAFNTGDDLAGLKALPLKDTRQDVVDFLARGQDVILSSNGHVTLLADVRETPEGLFVLRADPETGAATWTSLTTQIDQATIYFPIRADEFGI